MLSKKGFYNIISKYSRRLGLFIGIIFIILFVAFSNNLIWEVRVEGNELVSDKEIIEILKNLGVGEGTIKNKDILDVVHKKFLIIEPRISWISVNFDGTVAHVEVKETKVIPEKRDKARNVNIVASCDGVIKRIDVLNGKKEVNNGDAVTKGQLIISSFTESEKSETVVNSARGSVWASTIHNYEIFVLKEQIVDNVVSEENKFSVNVLGREISLPSKITSDKISIRLIKSRAKIFKNINLPFLINKYSVTEKRQMIKTLSFKEAGEIANTELTKRIDNDLSYAEIIEKSVSINETDEYYLFKFELSCIENIAKEIYIQ